MFFYLIFFSKEVITSKIVFIMLQNNTRRQARAGIFWLLYFQEPKCPRFGIPSKNPHEKKGASPVFPLLSSTWIPHLQRPYTKNVDRKPLKNLLESGTFQEPLGGSDLFTFSKCERNRNLGGFEGGSWKVPGSPKFFGAFWILDFWSTFFVYSRC